MDEWQTLYDLQTFVVEYLTSNAVTCSDVTIKVYSVDIAETTPLFSGNEHSDSSTLKIESNVLKINKNKII